VLVRVRYSNWNWLVHFTVWGSLLLYIILVLGEGSVIYFFPNQFFVFCTSRRHRGVALSVLC
jgi:hypothetical protein